MAQKSEIPLLKLIDDLTSKCPDQLRPSSFFRLHRRKHRDHPFKTSACFRGGGVKNLPNLPTDSTKKLPTVGG